MQPLVKRYIKRWQEKQISTQSAALSFYTLFSIGPIIALIILVLSYAFDTSVLADEMFRIAASFLGEEAAFLVFNLASQPSLLERRGIVALAGLFILFITATKVFAHLRTSLNLIFETQPTKRKIG